MQSLIQAELAEIAGIELVGIATGPGDGLHIIDQDRIDLVIADVFLDNGTAIELLERLLERHSKPAVIIITNTPSIELRERCLSLGALGFFDKAEGFDWLPEEIEMLRRRMALQQSNKLNPRISTQSSK
jgi:DNA-binding NarL/FixJ family response regulator